MKNSKRSDNEERFNLVNQSSVVYVVLETYFEEHEPTAHVFRDLDAATEFKKTLDRAPYLLECPLETGSGFRACHYWAYTFSLTRQPLRHSFPSYTGEHWEWSDDILYHRETVEKGYGSSGQPSRCFLAWLRGISSESPEAARALAEEAFAALSSVELDRR